jgi:hypothetical protein
VSNLSPVPETFAKADAGKAKWNDFAFSLTPNNKHVVIILAGSDSAQDELKRIGLREVPSFTSRRSLEEERTDAAMPVRFFVDSRVSPVVGWVPRGFEPVVLEAMTRLEADGKDPRIPAEIIKTRAGLRVKLLMGLTR